MRIANFWFLLFSKVMQQRTWGVMGNNNIIYLLVCRVRGKIIRSVLYSIVCNNCTRYNAHTWTDLTVLWIGFCLTGPISLWIDSFLCMCVFCVSLYIACCSVVTWWGEPGGIEAWSLGPSLPSVLWHGWLGHLTHKTPSRYHTTIKIRSQVSSGMSVTLPLARMHMPWVTTPRCKIWRHRRTRCCSTVQPYLHGGVVPAYSS